MKKITPLDRFIYFAKSIGLLAIPTLLCGFTLSFKVAFQAWVLILAFIIPSISGFLVIFNFVWKNQKLALFLRAIVLGISFFTTSVVGMAIDVFDLRELLPFFTNSVLGITIDSHTTVWRQILFASAIIGIIAFVGLAVLMLFFQAIQSINARLFAGSSINDNGLKTGNKTAHKLKLMNTPSVIFICVLTTAIFAQLAYQNRCQVIKCNPASWQKILDLVFAKSGKDFRFDGMTAHPAWWSSYTEAGPTAIEIDVLYVSLHPDSSQKDKTAWYPMYPTKFLQLDDQNWTTRVSTGGGWTSAIPPEDLQEKLRRVRVHPYSALLMTWVLARKESDFSLDDVGALEALRFDTRGRESIWEVSYVYNKTVLTFYVDAQTGQIISSEKDYVSK